MAWFPPVCLYLPAQIFPFCLSFWTPLGRSKLVCYKDVINPFSVLLLYFFWLAILPDSTGRAVVNLQDKPPVHLFTTLHGYYYYYYYGVNAEKSFMINFLLFQNIA